MKLNSIIGEYISFLFVNLEGTRQENDYSEIVLQNLKGIFAHNLHG